MIDQSEGEGFPQHDTFKVPGEQYSNNYTNFISIFITSKISRLRLGKLISITVNIILLTLTFQGHSRAVQGDR